MPLEQDLKDSEAGEKHQTEIFLLLSKPLVSFKRNFDEYPSFFSLEQINLAHNWATKSFTT